MKIREPEQPLQIAHAEHLAETGTNY